jgi:hypothetical protein
MTNTTNHSIALAAAAALPYFAADLRDEMTIAAYIDDANTDTLDTALDDDLRDLLHNANIDALIPDNILASMTDADIDALSDFFLDNSAAIASLIADALLLLAEI